MALGGWAVLTLAAMPATGTALAAGTHGHGHGHGYGATDGPGRLHGHQDEGSRGDEPGGGGDRRGDDASAPVPATVAAPAPAPAPTPSDGVQQPRQDIGTALGPISGTEPPAPTRAPEAGSSGTTGARILPLLSFDQPSPFAPRSVAGRLRDAPAAVVVQVAIRRGTASRGCGWWNPRSGRFSAPRRAACGAERWITASLRPGTGARRWRAALGGTLPDGSYRYVVRVLDAGGRPLAFLRV